MGLILRGIVALVTIFTLSLIAAAGFQIIEPIYTLLNDGTLHGDPTVVMLFASLGLIGTILVIILWWWLAPLRTDVRQGFRQGRR